MGVLLNQKTYLKSVDMRFPKQKAIDTQSWLWNEILHIIEAWGTANLSDQSWGSKKISYAYTFFDMKMSHHT